MLFRILPYTLKSAVEGVLAATIGGRASTIGAISAHKYDLHSGKPVLQSVFMLTCPGSAKDTGHSRGCSPKHLALLRRREPR